MPNPDTAGPPAPPSTGPDTRAAPLFVIANEIYGVDGSTVVWNPTTLEILGEVDQSTFSLVRDTPLSLNYSQAAVVGDRLFRCSAMAPRAARCASTPAASASGRTGCCPTPA